MLGRTSHPEVVEGARLTLGYVGVMSMLIGTMLLVPLVALLAYPAELRYAGCFVIPGTTMIGVGALANSTIAGREKGRLRRGQDALIIVITWLMAMFAGAVPFMCALHLNLTQAVFETISGLSTTTFSILDVERCPHIVLFYRSLLLYFGGIGLVLIMVSAISDAHAMRIFVTEGHTDRLLPNMKRSAQLILTLYTGLIVLGTLAYIAAGVGGFDALLHAIGAVCTGGFSTHASSVAFFRSVPVEIITMILMVLGGSNSALLMLCVTGRVRDVARDAETHAYLWSLGAGCVVVSIILWATGTYHSLAEAVRIGSFQVVSAITTTGYEITNTYAGWPAAARLILILLMLAGAQTDSTGGGIKQWRIAQLVYMMGWEVRDTADHQRRIHSNQIFRLGHRTTLPLEAQQDVLVFVLVYLSTLVAGTLVYTLYGFSIGASLFHFASALSTVGLSTGITQTASPAPLMWATIFGMLLGRLEVYPLLTAIAHVHLVAKRHKNKR